MRKTEKVRLGELLTSIRRVRREKGMPPTLKELSEDSGRSVAAIHNDLRVLRTQEKVEWQDGRPRTLRIVRRPR